MQLSNLILEKKSSILYITVNREAQLNALNKETLASLHTAFSQALTDDDIAGIILTGKGEKAFVAGADIKEFADYDEGQAKEMAEKGHDTVFNFIENSPKPVIAAINGYALGGGLELAMACHIRIAIETALLGLPETSLGIIPGYGGTQRLTRLVGKGKALEMILTADKIDAREAHRLGLINQVCQAEQLIQLAETMMQKIISKSPESIAMAIKAINHAGKDDGFIQEIDAFAACFGTENFKEGVKAFLEKRPPLFNRKTGSDSNTN